MFFGRNIHRWFCLIGLLLMFAATAYADTIRLRDGSILKGRVVSFSDGKFTLVIGTGTRLRELSFTVDEIESIQFEAPVAAQSAPDTRGADVIGKPVGTTESQKPENVSTTPRVIITDTSIKSTPAETKRDEPVKTEPAEPKTKSEAPASKPIEFAVKVIADNTNNGWTNSGWVVKKGQKIRIVGSGQISLGSGNSTGPSGSYTLADEAKLLKSVPTGALIAVIGDDNNDFIYVGSERTFVAARDGALFLGVNEGNLNDNSGNFDVKIEIMPESF